MRHPANVGELTYVLYKACLDYLNTREERYEVHAEIQGALANTAHEIYRRRTEGYENEAVERNGDLW